jgi:hypothetical protein
VHKVTRENMLIQISSTQRCADLDGLCLRLLQKPLQFITTRLWRCSGIRRESDATLSGCLDRVLHRARNVLFFFFSEFTK